MVISTEIIHSVMLPLLIAFAVSVALSPFVIPFLRKLKVGQTERAEGVQSHLKKAGTPTMGGTIILISVLVTCLFFVGRYPRIIPVLFLTLGFGIIGFLDDYLKVVLKRSDGLLPKQKMFCQLAVTTVFVIYMILKDESGLTMVLPFTDYVLDIKWITVPLAYFAIIGTDNGVNFTDGLDGLATGTSAIIGATLGILAYVSGNMVYADYLNIMYIPHSGELVVFGSAFIGATIGFLWYNSYPAQVFMGDTGSLALGGIIAVFAIIIHKELLIPALCGIFLMENLSVVMQVSYFKYTKRKFGEGRRIFLMAPLHHHFQKKGIPEPKIVTRFWIIGIILAVVTIVTLKIR